MSDAAVVDDLVERCAPLGAGGEAVVARRMFGGYGIYCGAAMFAIVADGVAFFKTDAENRADYEAAGGEPFVYESRGRTVVMSFHTLPDAVWANPHRFLPWMRSSLEAARRALAARRPRR